MTWAFVLVASVVVISTIITIWQVNQIARTTDVVREQRQPTTDSCVTLLYGINASLAELRAWILLGKPEFKQQRAKTWDETIQTSLTRLEELSVAWPDPSDAKRLRNVNQRIEQLRAYQDQIEALAHTPDNQPALKILFDEAIPRAATITDRITEIINIEKSQEANSARKLLLAYMADFRGSMALSLANIRAYQLSAEDQFQRLFETQWEKNEAAFVALDENRQSLTIEQVKAFDSLMHARSEFIPLPERMFQLRSADDWNRANYLLATKAAPTADEIRTLLDDMVDHQRQLMDDAQETASKQFVTLRGIQWLTVAFGLATCLILGLSLTRATAGPINQAVEMAKNMAEGNLDFRAEIQGTVEAETLGQSLDHMAGNLAALIQQIERQERQMRLVVEGSPSGMVMVDGEGTIVLVNARMEETFGYKRDELIGQPVDLFLPTQMRPQHVRDRTEFMRNPRVYEMGQGRDLFAVHKSGRQIPVEVGLTPVETESGMCVLATVVDISERKRAEEEAKKQTEMIAAAERQMRHVFEASTSGMVMVDERGTIILVNERMEQTFGYSRDELIGQPVEIFLPAEMHPQHVRDRAEFMHSPRVYEMGRGRDLYAVHKSGQQIPVEVGLTPVETDSGMCVLATVIDITERKLAQDELEQTNDALRRSNEELEQFAYIASHDLQEPLRMVSSYTQLLERRYRDHLDDDAREFIKYSVDGAKQMQSLIQDLLQYSLLSKDSIKLVYFDMNTTFDSALKNLKLLIDESNAEVKCEDLPYVYGDRSSIQQLLQNLLGNAIKYRDANRPVKVHVTARKQDDGYVFCVKDNGIGIDNQYFDRIFLIFKRLHTKEAYSGSGIGLAVCKRIVEWHGGRIWLQSTPGEGSSFFFYLPERAEP